jgi:putative protein-disulfide isomerase
MKVYYIMDPLCGWCYAAGSQLIRVRDAYRSRVYFDVIPAGLFAGEKALKPGEREISTIRQANRDITTSAGAEFGASYDALLETKAVLDSELPSRAIVAVQTIQPMLALDFTVALQCAYFQDGNDLNDLATYEAICEFLGLNTVSFFNTFETSLAVQLTKNAFSLAAIYARSFPSLWIEQNKSIRLLQQGYATFDELSSKLNSIILRYGE